MPNYVIPDTLLEEFLILFMVNLCLNKKYLLNLCGFVFVIGAILLLSPVRGNAQVPSQACIGSCPVKTPTPTIFSQIPTITIQQNLEGTSNQVGDNTTQNNNINPCHQADVNNTNQTTNTMHAKRGKKHVPNNGLIQMFLKMLKQLLDLLMQLLGGKNIGPSTNPTGAPPCPTPTSGSITPTTGNITPTTGNITPTTGNISPTTPVATVTPGGPTPTGGAQNSACTTTKNDLFLNPFNRNSAHHRPIGTGAQYASDTDPTTQNWLSFSSHSIGLNVGAPWGVSVANTTASDGMKTINPGPALCDKVVGFPVSIRFPNAGFDTKVVINGSGCTDGVTVIYDGVAQKPNQIRQYNWNNGNPVGGQYKTWDIKGLGHGVRPGDRIGTSASGVAALFGLLRGDEINDPSKKVEHALQMVLPRKGGDLLANAFVLPAVGGDGSMSQNTGKIPYGALFALPKSVNIDSLGLTPRGKRIAEAIQNYGIYAVDGSSTVAIRADQFVQNTQELKDAMHAIYPLMRMITNNDVLNSPTAGGGTPIAPNCAFDAP